MTDSKGPSDSLADILGPELSAKIGGDAKPQPQRSPAPIGTSGAAPRPPPGPGGKGAGLPPIPIPKIAPPPPPASFAPGADPASAALPRPIAPPAGSRPTAPAASPAVAVAAPKPAPARIQAAPSPVPAPVGGAAMPMPLVASSPPGVSDLAVAIRPGPAITGEMIAAHAPPAAHAAPAAAHAAPAAALDPFPEVPVAVAPVVTAAFAAPPAAPAPAASLSRPPLPSGMAPITTEITPPVDFAAAFGDAGAGAQDAPPPQSRALRGPAVPPLDDLEAEGAEPTIRPTFGAYWRGLSFLGRALLVLVPLLVLGGAVAATLTLRVPRRHATETPWRGFVASAQPLSSGPSATFPAIATLERGEPVERLATVGSLALVRDASGRVGYVAQGGLQVARPAVSADTAFTRCERRAGEVDAACEQRGREQLDACRLGCGAGDCAQQCATRFADCQSACAQPVAAAVPVAPAVAPPAPAGAPGVTEASPPAVVEDDGDKPRPRKGKKAKGAKRKGKRKG